MVATAAPEASFGDEEEAPAMPQTAGSGPTPGTVSLVRGDATVLRADDTRENPALGTAIGPGETVETGSSAVIGIDFAGQTGVAMGANLSLIHI